MSWKSFKSGNTVNPEYLNRIPNPESRIPNWSECTEKQRTLMKVFIQSQFNYCSNMDVSLKNNKLQN